MLNIITDADALRQKARPVQSCEVNSVMSTARKMITLMRTNDGVGLAANQVGDKRRYFVMLRQNGLAAVFINPRITNTSGVLVDSKEGCLSFPGHKCIVERHESIELRYMLLNGKPTTAILTGYEAIVAQHEIDHLDGILCIEKGTPAPIDEEVVETISETIPEAMEAVVDAMKEE